MRYISKMFSGIDFSDMRKFLENIGSVGGEGVRFEINGDVLLVVLNLRRRLVLILI